MKNIKTYILLTATPLLFLACGNGEKEYDATGSFEAIERTISAEATGRISSLQIEEGQVLKKGDTVGYIDVSKLVIQGLQVKSSIDAIADKTNDAESQVIVLESQLITHESQTEALRQQLINVNREVSRFEKLVEANAVPQKQLDDLSGQQLVLQKQLDAAITQSEVIKAQINAARTNVSIQNRAILSEKKPAEKQLEFIQEQIDDGIIINEFNGTVTNKLAYNGEFTSIGRPLYRIADLSDMTLRVYISGDQLPQIKLNQEVQVLTDDGEGGYREESGVITWISDKAEFTPKTIQTKNERANLVYAIKVKVPNDGTYKIGMYGEIKFE